MKSKLLAAGCQLSQTNAPRSSLSLLCFPHNLRRSMRAHLAVNRNYNLASTCCRTVLNLIVDPYLAACLSRQTPPPGRAPTSAEIGVTSHNDTASFLKELLRHVFGRMVPGLHTPLLLGNRLDDCKPRCVRFRPLTRNFQAVHSALRREPHPRNSVWCTTH
jgi:hypothetical protein